MQIIFVGRESFNSYNFMPNELRIDVAARAKEKTRANFSATSIRVGLSRTPQNVEMDFNLLEFHDRLLRPPPASHLSPAEPR